MEVENPGILEDEDLVAKKCASSTSMVVGERIRLGGQF